MNNNIQDTRVIFTKEMKKDYTILMPNMLDIHFKIAEKVLNNEGYNVEVLQTNNSNILNEGLKNVHNDTCYPAILVIGQFIDAIKSGKYDTNKLALLITQTGGGCRASNYIHLLRKALEKSGYSHIPVISISFSGIEKNPGFKLTIPLFRKLVYSIVYGDIIMWARNQVLPYEINKGQTDAVTNKWIDVLSDSFSEKSKSKYSYVKTNFSKILEDFAKIPVNKTDKVKVGVVGEIYVKFSPLGNNELEKFILKEGGEPVVPGVLDFLIFKIDNRLEDIGLYGGKFVKKVAVQKALDFLLSIQQDIIAEVEKFDNFRSMADYPTIKSLVKGYVGYGNKMGEGWMLTGEMLELIHSGVENIVCAQPFGCLPNHIVGKGMVRKIKENHINSNIVSIDYDPGASKVNQQNRIKLMLSVAKRK